MGGVFCEKKVGCRDSGIFIKFLPGNNTAAYCSGCGIFIKNLNADERRLHNKEIHYAETKDDVLGNFTAMLQENMTIKVSKTVFRCTKVEIYFAGTKICEDYVK